MRDPSALVTMMKGSVQAQMLVRALLGSGGHSKPPQGFKEGLEPDGVKEEELQGSVGSARKI